MEKVKIRYEDFDNNSARLTRVTELINLNYSEVPISASLNKKQYSLTEQSGGQNAFGEQTKFAIRIAD